MRKERPQHSSLRVPTRMDAFIGRVRLFADERQDEIVMTRHRISTTTTSFLALIAAATVSSGAAAQYGRAPAQNPFGAVQNLFGAPPAQTPYGVPPPAQTPYGAPTQTPYGAPQAQYPYGVPPTQTPYGAAPAQNPYGAPPAQTPYGAQAQNVYVYPSRGQSQEQVARDRYECQSWAAGETGFDPARSPAPGAASPPAANDLSGAAIQALGGSGGVGGAAASALRQYQQGNAGAAQSQQTQYAAQMDGYKRAQTACLQGRGYTVN